jgi:hypothetical protein
VLGGVWDAGPRLAPLARNIDSFRTASIVCGLHCGRDAGVPVGGGQASALSVRGGDRHEVRGSVVRRQSVAVNIRVSGVRYSQLNDDLG